MSDYFNLNNGVKTAKRRFSKLRSILDKRLALLIIISLALPITVVLALTQQNFSKFASGQEVLGISPTPTSVPNLQMVKVTRVIDGDTIEIEGGSRVRYIGIDTPETVDPRKPVQCFGKEASNKNKELVEGKTIGLEKDVSETDKYQRLLRYIYLGDVFINELLVREGYARSYSYPPDIKYQDLFVAAEKEARENNRGLWAACPTPTPTIQKITLNPASDAFVRSTVPNTNFGTSTNLEVDSSPNEISFLKFNLTSLFGKTIKSAKLRLKVSDPTTQTLRLKIAQDVNWSETVITYNTRPSLEELIRTFGASELNNTIDLDVKNAVDLRNGEILTVAITSGGDDSAAFYSKESAAPDNRPQLVIEYQ